MNLLPPVIDDKTDCFERSLAYPVIRINYRTYLVPATFSDYLTLRSYKLDSDAYRASFKFDVSAAIPGHSRRTSCITVTMPNQGHEVAKGFGAIILAKLLQAGFKNDDGRPIRVSHIARTSKPTAVELNESIG